MFEHQTIQADAPPSAGQLDELSQEGWELIQLLPLIGGETYIMYMRRAKVVG